MSDYSISSVSGVRVPETFVTPAVTGAPALPSGEMPTIQGRAEPAAARQTAQATQKTEEQKKAAETQAKKDLPISNMDSVLIRFSVDEKTNNLTVYVIDKASRRVLRAIPPEDLNKMKAGDLLELLV